VPSRSNTQCPLLSISSLPGALPIAPLYQIPHEMGIARGGPVRRVLAQCRSAPATPPAGKLFPGVQTEGPVVRRLHKLSGCSGQHSNENSRLRLARNAHKRGETVKDRKRGQTMGSTLGIIIFSLTIMSLIAFSAQALAYVRSRHN
jgi:hypothetical protein